MQIRSAPWISLGLPTAFRRGDVPPAHREPYRCCKPTWQSHTDMLILCAVPPARNHPRVKPPIRFDPVLHVAVDGDSAGHPNPAESQQVAESVGLPRIGPIGFRHRYHDRERLGRTWKGKVRSGEHMLFPGLPSDRKVVVDSSGGGRIDSPAWIPTAKRRASRHVRNRLQWPPTDKNAGRQSIYDFNPSCCSLCLYLIHPSNVGAGRERAACAG
jgi:hypothetical protein